MDVVWLEVLLRGSTVLCNCRNATPLIDDNSPRIEYLRQQRLSALGLQALG